MSAPKKTSPADRILPIEGLTFDDLLLLPRYVEFKRDEADLSVELHPKIKLKFPVISSPMDTVTEDQMAVSMAQSGGLGIIHRNLSIEKQVQLIHMVKEESAVGPNAAFDDEGQFLVGAAVGAGSDLEERVQRLLEAAADVIVVDSGHGHSKSIIDAVKHIKSVAPHQVVMAGNVATYDGAKALIDAGADILRVGMGPGSICTTRVVTGMGVPQIVAIMEAARAAEGTSTTVVADGGIRQMGDIAKALASGAHAVMLGSMLAGFTQSPGDMVTIGGTDFKQYRGMGSVGAMKKGSAERYGQAKGTTEKRLIPEGVEGLVKYKGNVIDFLFQIQGSLRSSLYYTGCKDLEQLRTEAEFIRITSAGLRESHPHTITIANAGANYMGA